MNPGEVNCGRGMVLVFGIYETPCSHIYQELKRSGRVVRNHPDDERLVGPIDNRLRHERLQIFDEALHALQIIFEGFLSRVERTN